MRRIWIFVLFLILFSAPFWWLGWRYGGTLYITAMMFAPALAALATHRLTGGEPGAFGWQGTPLRWVFGAWALTVVAITIACTAALLFGAAEFPNMEYLNEMAGRRGMSGWPSSAVILVHGALSFTVGIAALSGNALGEEIGWRGFLTPEAYARWGFTGASLFVGILWAAWHYPLFIGRAPVSALLAFTVGIVSISFAYTWFRLAARSVWPAVIMHGTHNAAFLNFWDSLIVESDSPWIGETGYALAIVYVLVAVYFWSRRDVAETRWRTDEDARPASAGLDRQDAMSAN